MYNFCHHREKGGACGAGATSASGTFSFFFLLVCFVINDFILLLIRDPNSVETFKSFENCIDWAINGSFSDQDTDEAKLGVFSQVDKMVHANNAQLNYF